LINNDNGTDIFFEKDKDAKDDQNGEYQLKFGSMLFDDTESEDINFDFEESRDDKELEDLPKGVL